MLAAVGVRRFTNGPPWFATVRQVAVYIACAALVAPFVTSFLDPAVVVLTHWDTSQHYWLLFQERFVSNVLTYLTVPPVILISANAGWRWLRTASRQRRLEAALLTLSVLGAAYLVFHTPLGVASSLPALLYAPVPVLLWAALRFGVGGSSAALLGLSFGMTSMPRSAIGPAVVMLFCFVGSPLLFRAAARRFHLGGQNRARMRFTERMRGKLASICGWPST